MKSGITRKRGRGRGRWKRKTEEDKKEDVGEKVPNNIADKDANDASQETTESDQLAPSGNVNEDNIGNVETHLVASKEEKLEIDEKVHLPPEGDEGEAVGVDNDEEEEKEKKKLKLTKTQKRKIAKFMSDLKSMIQSILDEEEDDTLQRDEKAAAQKLLLTISVKKIFNDDQRSYARKMLKRLEGNRRRRCRTTDQTTERFSPGRRGRGNEEIREELRIVSKKVKKRRRRRDDDNDEDDEQGKKRIRQWGVDPESGYKYDSDDLADWSDIGDEDDLYVKRSKKKALISRKEAQRRRQWAADDDAATAAGRSWPAIPRSDVRRVLGSLLEEVIKHDEAKGGIFSVPVPRDEFPEYYEQIQQPMDYSTMKKKLENGEYRSAQAMQKDFVLVMQNCLKFNSPDSDIVAEIRQQALMRPNLLRAGAKKYDLFLGEDGSVLTIVDDMDANGSRKRRGKRSRDDETDETFRREKEAKSEEE